MSRLTPVSSAGASPAGAIAAGNHRAASPAFSVGEQVHDAGSGFFPLLTALWLACTLVRFIAAMFVTSPRIFDDELRYWTLASSFHHGQHFFSYNVYYDIPSQLYSILLSPIFAAGDTNVEYHLAKLLSSLMFCSVVFPAYFLAREFLTRDESLIVAFLSLLIPGGAYSATLMTENLFYPTFILGFWLAYRTLYRGKLKDAVLAGIAFAIAYYVKPHVLFMMMAYGVSLVAWFVSKTMQAPSVKVGVKESSPGLLRRCIPFAVFACGLAIRFLETAGYTHSLIVILFGQSYVGLVQLGRPSVPLGAFLASGAGLLMVMIVSTAWLPVLAMIGTIPLWKRLDEPQRWFWFFSSCTAAVFLVMITRHNVLNDDILRSHERYVFQLSPLFFTWYFVSRKFLSRRWLLPVAVVVVAVISVTVARWTSLLTWDDASDSPTFSGMFSFRLSYHHGAAVIAVFLLLGGLLCLVVSLARKPRRLLMGWAIFLIACNLGWYGLQLTFAQREVKRFNDLAMYLKATVPPADSIGILQDNTDVRDGWYPNFWLSQPFYYYGWKQHDYWFTTPVTAASNGSLNFGNQQPHLLLASDSIALPYEVVHDFPGLHLRLYQVAATSETK